MKDNKGNLIGPGGDLIYYDHDQPPSNCLDLIALHGLRPSRGSKVGTSTRKTKRKGERLRKRLAKRQQKAADKKTDSLHKIGKGSG